LLRKQVEFLAQVDEIIQLHSLLFFIEYWHALLPSYFVSISL